MAEGDNNGMQSSVEMSFMDIEERQKIIKDRLILIGQNLIDLRDRYEDEMLSVKKDIEILKNNVEKLRDFMETISSELQRFAKKDDLEILRKQAKMFQPLEFATKEDLEKLKSRKSMK